MHKFLKSIGFTEVNRTEMENLLQDIVDHPDVIKVTKDSDGNEFAELSKEYGKNIGIMVRGIYDEGDVFTREYYCPYFIGTTKTTDEIVEIEKHAERESYAGVCDDIKLGVSLIFYLQNVVDYLAEYNGKSNQIKIRGAVLTGLASDGKILIPVKKVKKCEVENQDTNSRNQLIARAREGDENAIENLTMEDMDLYTIISRRIVHEDVLSIVDTYFMPYGIECDQYSILGDIIDYTSVENKYTGEEIYCLKISCNDLIFDVCLNKKDLLGIPEIGRRFKGNIWMQGSVCLD